jgi:phosphatidylinositol glycan class F
MRDIPKLWNYLADIFLRDRPWQAFPITILAGAYIGYAAGSLISRTPFLYGKRVQFAPEAIEEDEKKTN